MVITIDFQHVPLFCFLHEPPGNGEPVSSGIRRLKQKSLPHHNYTLRRTGKSCWICFLKRDFLFLRERNFYQVARFRSVEFFYFNIRVDFFRFRYPHITKPRNRNNFLRPVFHIGNDAIIDIHRFISGQSSLPGFLPILHSGILNF